MRNIFAFVLFSIFCLNVNSQIDIEFNNDEKIIINNSEINSSTLLSELNDLFGKPIIYKKYRSGKINYHYEEIGISVHTKNEKIVFLGINLNWDEDEGFPKTTYKGELKIDNIKVNNQFKEDSINNFKNIKFADFMLPGLYYSKPKRLDPNYIIIIGFKDELVTQVAFEIH